MTDDAAFEPKCPVCVDVLRPVGDRLVCPRDHGMLVPAESLRSLVGPLEIDDDGKTIHACPRCEQRMEGCQLVVRAMNRDAAQHFGSRCREHGIWVGADLPALLLAGARAGGGGTGGGRSYGGAGSVRSRVATSLSAQVRSAPRAPSFRSAYADRTLACPRCRDAQLTLAGDRWDCPRCTGTFVEMPALELMMSEMTGAPWQAPISTGADGTRACPICTAPLVVDTFGESIPSSSRKAGESVVQVDRCGAHGVWLDPDELVALLQSSVAGDERRAGVGTWFRRLFFEDP